MSEEKLQSEFSDIINDLISMSAAIITKCVSYRENVRTLDTNSIDGLSTEIETLMSRVNSNVTIFTNNLKTAVAAYKGVADSPPKKLNLSLKKNPEDKSDEVVPQVPEEDKAKASENDDNASETDSQKTIIEANECPKQEPDKSPDPEKPSNEISQNETELARIETMSFDFDDDANVDQLKSELDNIENKNKGASHDLKSDGLNSENLEESHNNNRELLDLLNKTLVVTQVEDDAQEALRILEEDFSTSVSDFEDDSSYAFSDSDWERETNEDSTSSNDESDHEEKASPIPLRECNVEMRKKVDELNDAEIDRLCNLHNINKRKIRSEIRKYTKKKSLKRIRVMSSSSSSSDAFLSDGSATRSLPSLDVYESHVANKQYENNVTALADELAKKLASDESCFAVSSESEDEFFGETPAKKAKVAERKTEVKQEKVDEEACVKKKGIWRNQLHFDSSTSSENDSDSFDVICTKEEIDEMEEKEEEDESKSQLKVKIVEGEVVIITDSDSDDVTLVDEQVDDDVFIIESPGGKGRRKIRDIIADEDLNELTQLAKSEEETRIQRVEKHLKTLESVQSQREELVLDVNKQTGLPLIIVDYQLAQKLKPHQKDGVKFMWAACYESVETLKKNNPGTGCILAHCMGLGKTLQVITLIHTLFKYTETKTKHILIACPLSTVCNWKNEFKRSYRKIVPIDFQLFFIIKGSLPTKVNVVQNWRRHGGVLIMGYEAFQNLSNENLKVDETVRKSVYQGLIDPGPDLIVCDEGHQLKNDRTLRTKALMKVKTKRRIVLTGTPMQNNLKEYYYMVEFVKPHLLGKYNEYTNRFETPIKNGQYHDSTARDIKLMKMRTHVLTKLLKSTIHRVEASVLRSYLPEIFDYSIFIKLSDIQRKMYETYIAAVTGKTDELARQFLGDVMILNLNNLHPLTLHFHYTKPKKIIKKKKHETSVATDNEQDVQNESPVIIPNWYQNLLPHNMYYDPLHSPKMKVILGIVDEAERVGDKILIFAQYLVELDTIEHFLKNVGTTNHKKWLPHEDYYRMDGSTPVEDRDSLCRKFNTESKAKIFLLTHRVGGLGLNLTGANRVVLIGSNHNPSYDTQSMYRVYRFGQTKKCYVYRLLSLGTMEEKIYRRCVSKLHLSGTVVDKLHFVRHFRCTDLHEMYNIEFNKYDEPRPIPVVPVDTLLATLIHNNNDIFKYHPTQLLLENRPEEELNDAEKKLAWEEFNNIKNPPKPPPLPFPAGYSAGRGIAPPQLSAINSNSLLYDKMNRPSTSGNLVRNPVSSHATSSNKTYIPFLQSALYQPTYHNRPGLPPPKRLHNIMPKPTIVPLINQKQQELPNGEFNYTLNKVV